ncbi:superfamily II DNA or RNA helicase [Microbacterium resistens]|uniref:Superfamily II DNA or RNA helicase n=1 Tax=Microbacterium resistens TaxID=156977 RepID=A0ABU1SG67_9MICO|nr:DEAD/DEAH box helicase [Microbacterium resistens]MDR6868547.1 superfamily II DNA or RNA helicase [Microbacterium resistens]
MPDASVPSWRSLLPERVSERTPLALGIELRRRDAANERHWSARPLRTASARDLVRDPGELFLGVRPLRPGSVEGTWIQGDATWDGVRRRGSRFAVPQSRWFADLLSIARESLLSGTAGDWLLLDPVESPLLWPHLRRAGELGIPFVATEKSTTLIWAAQTRVGIVAETSPDGDGILLTAEAETDGTRFSGAAVRPIGATGFHAHRVVGTAIELTVAERALDAPLRALMGAGGRAAVRETDRAAFVREALPHLRRRGELRVAGTLVLPEPSPPRPVLSVVHRSGDIVDFRIEWEYEGLGRFPFDDGEDGEDSGEDGEAAREPAVERERAEDLRAAWRRATEAPFASSGTVKDGDAAEFVTHVAPALEEEGVLVVVTGTPRRYHELTGEPEITISTVETTDADWFDLGVIVRIAGRNIPFEPLFRALSLRRTKLLLVDGTWFALRHPALDRLRELIDEAVALGEWETGPRIHRTHVSLWADFEDLADEARPATEWRERVLGLDAADGVPSVEVPRMIQAELRPYQRQGLDWLALLWRHRLGGLLADDMGLGKTLQFLALIARIRATEPGDPCLVVAPTSVLGAWAQEAARFAPGLRIAVIGRTRASSALPLADEIGDADLVLTSYTILRLDADVFAERRWSAVILDEAQNVKNPATRQHQAVVRLTADAVYAASGTPIENGLADLWAILSLTAPGLFASSRRFREEYIQPIEDGKVPENAEGAPYRQARIERLRRRIRPFVLRRTKELVAPELPERQEQVLRIELSARHRAVYDAVLQRERQKVLGLLPDLERTRFIVFRSLTLLRMLSLAPGLIDAEDERIGSRKLDALVEHILELRAEGHRALVFSQFTSFLRLAEQRLRAAGVRTAYLDGSTRDRAAVVDGFRSGEATAFLLSLKAGGVGLTLTEADYVFLLDPWWNPAAEAQAADRAHRIGQRNRVFVYRMIAAGTIEEKVLDLQRRKARLTAAVMDDDDLFAQALTADDIRDLLGG